MSIHGISCLPTELLCDIFWLAIGEATRRRDGCRLALVCRRWRECIEGSAPLWTDISASDGLTYVHRALEKSQGAMIDLLYWDDNKADTNLEAFLVEVGPHIARWRSLTALVRRPSPSLASALARLTTAQPPGLESLVLRYPCSRSLNTITLFGGAPAPSTLKDLSLYRFQVAVEPLSLSGLVSLCLRQVATISTPQLFEILRGSPLLETLDLVDNLGLETIESQPSTIKPIELAKLVSLYLSRLDHEGANCILSNIRIPNSCRSSICSDISGISARSILFTSSIAHLLHKAIPTADLPSSAIRVMAGEENGCTIQFRGIDLQLLVDGEDQIHEVLGWLADGLGSEAAECPIHLILDFSEMNPIRLAAVPPPLVVKHLSISDSPYGPLRGSRCIEKVQPPDPTSSGWLLPHLESLSATCLTFDSQRLLLSLLRSRYGGAGGTELKCPMSLRSIELRGEPRTEGLVEEIKGILGEADVFWTDL